jgi:hypothetical protein
MGTLRGPPATHDLTIIDQSYPQMHPKPLYRIQSKSQTLQGYCRGTEMTGGETSTAWCEGEQSADRMTSVPYTRMILI